jgi:DtxR family Mn-dependent transcriptional regulator
VPTPAIEEYLESIYKLQARGLRVIGARLAEDLGVSPPTVTEMLRRLRQEGFIVAGGDKEVQLTEEGRKAAEVLIRRHRLSERLLTDILGMPWSQAHDEACKFEHVISPAVEASLARVLDYPTTCPHGNPIPGSPGQPEKLQRLSEARAGARVVLRCVEAEDEELLAYVEGLGLLPGTRLSVVGFAPMEGPVELLVKGRPTFVALAAAERLLVQLKDGGEDG